MARTDTREAASIDPVETQASSMDVASSQDLLAADDTSPWLSWGWIDSSFDLMPPMNPQATDDHQVSSLPAGSTTLDVPRLEQTTSSRIASIIDVRLDPVEYHRQSILACMEPSSRISARDNIWHWLHRSQFPLLLKTYFVTHHRHTPIIHLPTLNIAECPTCLIFAIVLVAASSLPSLELQPDNLVALVECGYHLAIEPGKVWNYTRDIKSPPSDIAHQGTDDETTSIGALEAIILLAIIDRIILKRTAGSPYIVELDQLCRLARTAKVFDERIDPPNDPWHRWASMESRRRLAAVKFTEFTC